MESTLSLSIKELEQAVGFYLGYGRGVDAGDGAWTQSQQSSITDCINSGLRRFYYPTNVPGESAVYDWSFMRPYKDLTLPAGETSLVLPDDFGGIEGNVIVKRSDNAMGVEIRVTTPGDLISLQQMYASATGRPQMVSIEPIRGVTPKRGQRFKMNVYPAADVEYTLSMQYYVLPDALTATNPYPLGGLQHAETIRESCLAVAEQQLDDTISVHSTQFMNLLAASVGADRRNKPQFIGYNGDTSDRVRTDRGWVPATTVNGILYEN